MDANLKSASPARSSKAATTRSKRSGSNGKSVPASTFVRKLLVIFAAASVFLVSFILDTGAVVRVFWAGLTGQFGEPESIAAFAILLLLCGVVGFVLYRPTRPLPAKTRNKAIRRPDQNEVTTERKTVKDNGPATIAPSGKRRGAKAKRTATDHPD